jgi:histone-lysine N-methyltransferase SETMAR
MNVNIENPATCSVLSVIRFLNARNVRLAEIYRQMVEVYGEGIMNEGNVRKWWRHTEALKPKKFKQTLSARKIMAALLWGCKGILLVDFMTQWTTINSESYCETLKKLWQAIQNRRCGLLPSGVCLLHNIAWLHTTVRTRALLEQFGWEIFEHPPYSPDLAPSDYHLFLHLKIFLSGQSLGSDQETKNVVQDWLVGLAVSFYDDGMKKLVSRYDRCLNLHGDYVEK